MKTKHKRIIIWSIVVIALLSLVFAYNTGIIKIDINKISTAHSQIVSDLELIKNPENYLGKEVTIKNTYIDTTFDNAIWADESDGNRVKLRYKYYREINCDWADVDIITGTVLNTSPAKQGLIPVNEDETPRQEGFYYLNITYIKCSEWTNEN